MCIKTYNTIADQNLEKMTSAVEKLGGTVDLLFVFSCVSRRLFSAVGSLLCIEAANGSSTFSVDSTKSSNILQQL